MRTRVKPRLLYLSFRCVFCGEGCTTKEEAARHCKRFLRDEKKEMRKLEVKKRKFEEKEVPSKDDNQPEVGFIMQPLPKVMNIVSKRKRGRARKVDKEGAVLRSNSKSKLATEDSNTEDENFDFNFLNENSNKLQTPPEPLVPVSSTTVSSRASEEEISSSTITTTYATLKPPITPTFDSSLLSNFLSLGTPSINPIFTFSPQNATSSIATQTSLQLSSSSTNSSELPQKGPEKNVVLGKQETITFTACPECHFRFKAGLLLEAHLVEVHGDRSVPCSVPSCPVRFASSTKAEEHRAAVHTCFCSRCSRLFGNRTQLLRHKASGECTYPSREQNQHSNPNYSPDSKASSATLSLVVATKSGVIDQQKSIIIRAVPRTPNTSGFTTTKVCESTETGQKSPSKCPRCSSCRHEETSPLQKKVPTNKNEVEKDVRMQLSSYKSDSSDEDVREVLMEK